MGAIGCNCSFKESPQEFIVNKTMSNLDEFRSSKKNQMEKRIRIQTKILLKRYSDSKSF